MSEPERISNEAHRRQQRIRQRAIDVIERVGDYERALGWLRYEAMRKLNSWKLAELRARNLKGEHWDDMIDEIILENDQKLSNPVEEPIRSCPFCGSGEIKPYFWRAKLMMACSGCNASGPWACGWAEAVDAANDKPKEEALRLWNLRANERLR